MAYCRDHQENDMSIHIKNQHGRIINNVDGDQTIYGDQVVYGDQRGIVVTSEDARRAVNQLRDALADAALDDATSTEAHARLAEIDAAAYGPEADKHRAVSPLKRLAKLLADAGSLATAEAALIGPLQALANWLGAH
jgi:hypothetical protein